MAPSLAEWESRLPPPPRSVANYTTFQRSGDLAFTAGIVPLVDGELQAVGLLGRELTQEEGYEAARTSGLLTLSLLKEGLGGLDRVARLVHCIVYVASQPKFTDQHRVADGATDLFVEVLGASGRPTRAAVGVACLPLNAPVEVALTAAVRK